VKPFRVLTLGDVVGKPGRLACREILPRLRREEGIDFVIANGENLAQGSSITEGTVRELLSAGVDVITSGDHVFRKPEAEGLLRTHPRVLRPANYPASVAGQGSVVLRLADGTRMAVLNLIGRVFLKTVDCPFEIAEREVGKLSRETPLIFVDFHAEATSEKVALGWFLDGKVSAVFGTHTHIQTADETILPQGTGYMTDLGMCGPYRSVIGRKIDLCIRMFRTQLPVRLDVAEEDARLSGAIFEVDPGSGKTLSVCRVHERVEVPVA